MIHLWPKNLQAKQAQPTCLYITHVFEMDHRNFKISEKAHTFLAHLEDTHVLLMDDIDVVSTNVTDFGLTTLRSFELLDSKAKRIAVVCQIKNSKETRANNPCCYAVLDPEGNEVIGVSGKFYYCLCTPQSEISIYLFQQYIASVKQDWIGNFYVVIPAPPTSPTGTESLLYRIYKDRKCFSVITPFEFGSPKLVASIEKCVRKGSEWDVFSEQSYKLSRCKRFGLHITPGITMSSSQKAILLGLTITLFHKCFYKDL